MKIRLILSCSLIALAVTSARAFVIHSKPKIKNLDLSFSCDASHVKTIDECYYSGIQELNKMGCHLSGPVSSVNCDSSKTEVNGSSGETHVRNEWACSVPSTNCKETTTEQCPLDYREVNRFHDEFSTHGKVFLNFLSYCVLDVANGRKDPTQIRQNEPEHEH